MHTKITVLLNTIDYVKRFATKASEFNSDIDVIKDGYVVDGKSILGILSVDLRRPLVAEIHSDDINEIKRFNDIMSEFVY